MRINPGQHHKSSLTSMRIGVAGEISFKCEKKNKNKIKTKNKPPDVILVRLLLLLEFMYLHHPTVQKVSKEMQWLIIPS